MDGEERGSRTNADLARLTARVARAVEPDAVICGTETGSFYRLVKEQDGGQRLIAATPSAETYDAFTREDIDVRYCPRYGP